MRKPIKRYRTIRPKNGVVRVEGKKRTCCSSSLRMSGMLMQLAAATAVKGTRRPTSGGMDFTSEFSPNNTPNLIMLYYEDS